MNVVFRTDASLSIGSGHVMRCLTLAERLRSRGATCSFISRQHPGNLLQLIAARGFSCHAIPPGSSRTKENNSLSHSLWLGASQEEDAAQCKVILSDLPCDWLVVDHYALDARWEEHVRPPNARVLAIDDLADRPHACNLLLDQNLGRSAVDYISLISPETEALIGPHYALLRPEFALKRNASLERREFPQLRNILIIMGGVDSVNASGSVLLGLQDCVLPENINVTVVLGRQAPHAKQLLALSETLPWPTKVIVDSSDMATLMLESDLAIGAAGGTALERCCLGLPSLLVVLADNQWTGARALANQGAAVLLGTPDAIPSTLCPSLVRLNEAGQLSEMSQVARRVVDGLGTERVASIMENYHV